MRIFIIIFMYISFDAAAFSFPIHCEQKSKEINFSSEGRAYKKQIFCESLGRHEILMTLPNKTVNNNCMVWATSRRAEFLEPELGINRLSSKDCSENFVDYLFIARGGAQFIDKSYSDFFSIINKIYNGNDSSVFKINFLKRWFVTRGFVNDIKKCSHKLKCMNVTFFIDLDNKIGIEVSINSNKYALGVKYFGAELKVISVENIQDF